MRIKNYLTAAALTCFAAASVAQNRGYHITINDQDSVANSAVDDKLKGAFFKVYPEFAEADGYHTKRKVILNLVTDIPTIWAREGEIKVNSEWVKHKSQAKIEKELKSSLINTWVSYSVDKKKGYTLTFVSKDKNLDPAVRKNLIDTYFKVYPVLVKTFNEKSTHNVVFVVDTTYKAVAEASGNRILFSAGYMKAHPTDIDVVTHETMHIVQGYGYSAGPVWLTEGMADYIRYKYGVDNIGSKWSLPPYNAGQAYTMSYRVTARFFVWLEQHVKPGIITALDLQLRAHQYNDGSWKDLTGKTLDELWDDYGKNPKVDLVYSGK